MQSPVINLGAAGLALAYHLYRQAPGAVAVLLDSSGVAAHDQGNGDYYFTGLPDASGLNSYSLIIANAASPNVALYVYSYDAQGSQLPPPPTLAGWTYRAPSIRLAVGDTSPIPTVYLGGLPADVSAATAVFKLYPFSGGDPVFTSAPGEAVVTAGAPGQATLTMPWDAGDTATAGIYFGQFELQLTPLLKLTVPADDAMHIRIVAP